MSKEEIKPCQYTETFLFCVPFMKSTIFLFNALKVLKE